MARNKQLDPQLLEKLQQHYAVQPDPEFLPALKSDLLERFPEQQPRLRRSRKLAYALITAAAVLVIVLFATPMGRALAQEFVELFSRSESNVMPNYPGQTAIARDATQAAAQTLTPGPKYTLTPTPTVTPGPADKRSANYSIKEVEQIAGFDVLVPTYLPWPIEFYGASYDPETNIVYLFYKGGMLIRQEPITGTVDCDLCSEIGPSASIKMVPIGNIEGEFVIGVWKMDNEGNRIWTFEPWSQRLRWHTDDTVFEIGYMGPPGTFSKEDLAEIAESFR